MSVKRKKPVTPQTCATNVHQDDLLFLIRSVQISSVVSRNKVTFPYT